MNSVRFLTLWLTATFLSAGMLTAILFTGPRSARPPFLLTAGGSITPEPASTFEAQTARNARSRSAVARITARLIRKKFDDLRQRALRLQLQEEGRELLEEWLGPVPDGEQHSGRMESERAILRF